MLLIDIFEASDLSLSNAIYIGKRNFKVVGLELSYNGHALDRANERDDTFDPKWLLETLQAILEKYKQGNPALLKVIDTVTQTGTAAQLTFKHLVGHTTVNMPCVIELTRGGKVRFAIKTVKVRSDFKTYPGDTVIRV